MKRKAFITGITGQDGSYLAEFLIHKGYEVHGIIRRSSNFNTQRIDRLFSKEINKNLYLHYGDLLDSLSLFNLIKEIQPDEIYNLGAQSHVKVSFELPEYTSEVNGIGTLRILEAMRSHCKFSRMYQASTSELFGTSPPPQDENTPFCPRSPYAISKLYAYWIVRNYRDAYGLFASNGILFNHESPRRNETFVTRKITKGIVKIMKGQIDLIYLGNLDAKRDWGFAPEYVELMWKILQHSEADDFVVGTGEMHSVREFIEYAFSYLGIRLRWIGSALDERGIIERIENNNEITKNFRINQEVIKIDPKYFRPTEVEALQANPKKVKKIFNWEPRIKFEDLVKIMIDYDLLFEGYYPIGDGIEILKKKDFNYTENFSID